MTDAPIETAWRALFAREFAVRFLCAIDRRAYLRGHWIDLVALIPSHERGALTADEYGAAKNALLARL